MRIDRGRLVGLVLVTTVAVLAVGQVSAVAGGGKGGGGGTRCSRRSPCDTTPPTISILNPVTGTSTSGAVTVTGDASDDRTVTGIVVRVDGGAPQSAFGTGTWTEPLDTTSYTDGTHTITASATDGAGNVGSASITVDVSNLPAPVPSPSPSPSPIPSPSPGTPVPEPSMTPGTIGGWAYQDLNANGVFETSDTPLAAQHFFLFAGDGTYVGNTYSDATGRYLFTGLADGAYRVQYDSASWWALRQAWVPDTTGTIFPRQAVTLSNAASADFGWRLIGRSSDAHYPISEYVGPDGLRVQSYDDVVPAREIYDDLMTGAQIGPETRFVTIRFDLNATGVTSTSTRLQNGVYDNYSATSYVSYTSWLDEGVHELFHEYGHAWSLYYAYIVQQDPTMTGYLRARGLLGDLRVDASYAWSTRELIAEDYRQLFGPAGAQDGGQINMEIPAPSDVPGLRDYLATAFTQPPN